MTYKNESVDDVTLRYVDVDSHKKALETEQERLLALLEKAENVEDIITIENRLSDVRYELENYESQIRLLDNQIDYSTVYVDISEVSRVTDTGKQGFFEEVASRFSDSVYVVLMGLRGFAIGILGSLPILVVWGVILAVVVILLRKFVFKKSKKNKKNTDQTERKPAVNIDITGFRVIEARKLFFVANCTARCYNTYNWVKYRLPKKEDKEDIAHGC